MIKLVVCAAKVSIKIEYPNNFLLFIENLCFCSLKKSVVVDMLGYIVAPGRSWFDNQNIRPGTHTTTTSTPKEHTTTTRGTHTAGKSLNIYV